VRVHESEQEQIDAVKRWWKENGKFTIFIIILALVVSFGWRFWKQHEMKESIQASVMYEQLLSAMSQKNVSQFDNLANQLQDKHDRTPYAKMAALLQAEQEVKANKYNEALTKLTWVIKEADDKAIVQMARVRAARIFIADKKYQQALTMLDKVDDKAFQPAKLEAKGDALAAMGKKVQAKIAYEQALAAMPKTEAMYPIVQMKLAQVNVAVVGGEKK